MDNFSFDTNSYYDSFIAIVPILTSIAVVFIGFFQYKTTRHKFRLDLYNRRFAIYEKALAYFQAYYSTNQDSVADNAKEFIRAYRESIFLFGRDSEVYKALTELKDTISFLLQLEKNSSQSYRPDDRIAWSDKQVEKRDLHEVMKTLEEAFIPWLDFKKIEN